MKKLMLPTADLKKSKKEKLIIGHYGFWVKLTYLSVVSALLGIYFALGGNVGFQLSVS